MTSDDFSGDDFSGDDFSGKVLLYSHDSYGLGHLRRSLAIARRLLGGNNPAQVALASGSPVLHLVDRPRRLVSAQLPPVTKTGPDEYAPLEPNISMSMVRRARTAVLTDVVLRWQPDVLLVDHAPQGLKGELLPVFDAIRSRQLPTKIVLGLRDILDEPAAVRATWAEKGVYDTLVGVYDKVMVYGEREVFDVVSAYEIPEPLASGVEYCGYVTAERPGNVPARRGDYLLGTVGGGGDGVEVLIATLEAAVSTGSPAVLCTGPLMSAADRRLLEEAVARHAGAGRSVTVLEHVQDLPALAREARAVVTRGGYNTLGELLSLSVPVVVVPRVWPRREQLLRAQAFARRGLVELVDPRHADLGERVAAAVSAATAGHADRRPIDLDGARRVVEVLSRTLAGDRAPAAQVGARIPA